MSDRYDAIVVGAGPAGSAAAAHLAAQGHRVALVDRARFPRPKPCGDYLNAGARERLGRLGVLDALRAAGAVDLAGMTVYAQDGSAFTGTFPASLGLAVRRSALDAALVEAAVGRGAVLLEEVHVEGTELERGGRILWGRRGRDRVRLRGRLVIGADGMRSRVAAALGLASPPVGARFTVGTYVVGLDERTAPVARPEAPAGARVGEMHTGRAFYCGVAWLGDGTANVTTALPGAWLRGFGDAAFRRLLASLPGLRDRVARLRRVAPFAATGPLVPRRHRAVAERALLAGDAAGFLDPFTGQGVAQALWSAELAAEVAGRALADDDLSQRRLGAYDRLRGREMALRLLATRGVHAVVFGTALFPRIARRLEAQPAEAEWLFGTLGWARPPGDLFSPARLWRLVA